MDEQNHHIVEYAQGFRIVGGDNLVDRFGHCLGAKHFVRMEAAIDPHDRLSFRGQLRSLFGSNAFGCCQLAGNLLVTFRLSCGSRAK